MPHATRRGVGGPALPLSLCFPLSLFRISFPGSSSLFLVKWDGWIWMPARATPVHDDVTCPSPLVRTRCTVQRVMCCCGERRGPVLTGARVSGLVAGPQREGPWTGVDSKLVERVGGSVSVWDCDGSRRGRYANPVYTTLHYTFAGSLSFVRPSCYWLLLHHQSPSAPGASPGNAQQHVGFDESTHPDPTPSPQQPSRTSAERFVGLVDPRLIPKLCGSS